MYFLLMMSVPPNVMGETPPGQHHHLETIQMSAEVKSMLRSGLSNFFDPASFFLDLQIDLDGASARQGVYYPGQDVIADELPGVPFVRIPRLTKPDVALDASGVISTEQKQTIQRIALTIYADNIYDSDQLGFMRMLAGIMLRINEDPGDQIHTIQMQMPRLTTLEQRPERPDEPAQAPALDVSMDPISFAEPPPIPDEPVEDRAEPPPLFSTILPETMLFLIVLMIVLLAIYLLKIRKKAGIADSLSWLQNQKSMEASTNAVNVSAEEPLVNRAGRSNGDRDIQKEYFFLITLLMEQTNDLALLFESWINRNELEAANKIAKIINMADPRYIKLFKGIINDYSYSSIEEAMQDPDNNYIEIDPKELGRFAEELRSHLQPGFARGISKFHFLSYMDNDMLLKLSDELDSNELSVLVDYLPDEKAAMIFDKIGPNITASVLKVNVRRLPVDFKQINCLAEKWFVFFLQQKAGKDFNTMNLGRIVGLLEESNIEKQEQLLNSIREKDPALHKTIHSRMLTWEKLANIEPQLLKTALSGTDSRTLAVALSDAESTVKEKMLSVRPKRERLLINEMMSEADSTPAESKENAKQTLLKTVREYARTNTHRIMQAKAMKRHYLIILFVLPFFWTSCSSSGEAVDKAVAAGQSEDPVISETVVLSEERMALLDSVVAIQANDALNYFVMAQREASRGNTRSALEYAALSLEIFETADAMVLKGAAFNRSGRHEDAVYWFDKAMRLDPSINIELYKDLVSEVE